MNFRKLTLFNFLLCLALLIFFCGKITSAQKQTETLANHKDSAAYFINELKNGALVVRLKTRKKTIGLYRKSGKEKVAQKIEKEQADINRMIYESFYKHFDFCNVYFIFNHHTNTLLEEGDRNIFLGKNLTPDKETELSEKFYLFLDHGVAYNQYSRPVDFKKSDTAKPAGKSPTPMLSDALVIKDQHLNQLRSPFPFYVKIVKNYTKMDLAVKKLNERLHHYFDKCSAE